MASCFTRMVENIKNVIPFQTKIKKTISEHKIVVIPISYLVLTWNKGRTSTSALYHCPISIKERKEKFGERMNLSLNLLLQTCSVPSQRYGEQLISSNRTRRESIIWVKPNTRTAPSGPTRL